MKIFEISPDDENYADSRIKDNPNIDYEEKGKSKAATARGEIDNVIAYLKGDSSRAITILAKRYSALDKAVKELERRRDEIKEQRIRKIFDIIFSSDDAVYTRIIDTVSFTIQMKKDTEEKTTEKAELDIDKFMVDLAGVIDKDLLPVVKELADKHTKIKKTVTKGKIGAIMSPVKKQSINESKDIKSLLMNFTKYISQWVNLKMNIFDKSFNKLKRRYQQESR